MLVFSVHFRYVNLAPACTRNLYADIRHADICHLHRYAAYVQTSGSRAALEGNMFAATRTSIISCMYKATVQTVNVCAIFTDYKWARNPGAYKCVGSELLTTPQSLLLCHCFFVHASTVAIMNACLRCNQGFILPPVALKKAAKILNMW
jgi:hypothetical protein